MRRLKTALTAMAALSVIGAAACSPQNSDGVACTEKSATPLTLECAISGELSKDRFDRMIAAAEQGVENGLVTKTAEQLAAVARSAGTEIKIVTEQLQEGSKIRGTYDSGLDVMGSGVVNFGEPDTSRTIMVFKTKGVPALEALGGNGKLPLTAHQIVSHEYVHVRQVSERLDKLTRALNEYGFKPVFGHNWGGETSYFAILMDKIAMATLAKPKAGETYEDVYKERFEKGNKEFVESFDKLLASLARNDKMSALEALTLEGDGLARAFDAWGLIREAHAYMAIPHSAVYEKSDIENILKAYIKDTEIEKQIFPNVSQALDQLMRGYVALEMAGVKGVEAHDAMARIVGGVFRPANDYAAPFDFLKQDIGELVKELDVSEPTEAEIKSGWAGLLERNMLALKENSEPLFNSVNAELGTQSRIQEAVSTRRKFFGLIPVGYCKNPQLNGVNILEGDHISAQANPEGTYTVRVTQKVNCQK